MILFRRKVAFNFLFCLGIKTVTLEDQVSLKMFNCSLSLMIESALSSSNCAGTLDSNLYKGTMRAAAFRFKLNYLREICTQRTSKVEDFSTPVTHNSCLFLTSRLFMVLFALAFVCLSYLV